MLCIDPFLSSDSVIVTVSGQQLRKHIPTVTNRHTTIQLLFKKGCLLCGLCQDVMNRITGAMSSVRYRRLWREDLSAWSWRISTVRSHCQGMAGKDTASWKRLSRCCGDLWIVEISNGTVPSHVHKTSVNQFTNPNPIYSHTYDMKNLA
jgi:hypothetical protein